MKKIKEIVYPSPKKCCTVHSNRQFDNKRQSLTVTDKQAGLGKLLDWSKKNYCHMFNIKLKEKSDKMSSKALPLKIQFSKKRQRGTMCPPPGKVGLQVFLIKMFAILIRSVFWKKGYDAIISLHDVTNKNYHGTQIIIVDVVMWPKFDNSSISMREVIITSIL